MKKRIALTCLLLVFVLFLAACGVSTETPEGGKNQAGSNWPTKTVEIVVPFKAGGDTDFNARTYGKYLEQELGQTVVVINTEGAGGSLAAESVKTSKADGYKIFFGNTGFLLNEITGISDYTFDDAFETVGIVAKSAGEAIVVRSDLPVNTVPELIKLSQDNPGKYRITSVTGGIMHYFAIRLNDLGGKFNIVDAGGVNDRIAALKGGHVDVIVNTVQTVMPYVESGDFKILAVTSDQRSDAYPDIPTCVEQGIDITIGLEYNMFLPKGTDQAIIEKLSQAIKNVSEKPEYADEIKKAYDQVPYLLNLSEAKERLFKQRDMFLEYKSLFQG
ncbi:tripartite tricarboxylate transporter substrate binding protein [Geosporobacter ferrireducens]|nr:tripartite tricarboxylate transporter substrate binding protein [Geosporobacter ferrireducens]